MFKALSTAALIAVSAAVAASGCGSSENADAGGSTQRSQAAARTLPKAEFAKEANAICAQGRTEVLKRLAAFQKQNGELNPRDVGPQAVKASLLPVFRDEIEEIQGVGVPAGGKSQLEAFLRAKTQTLDTIESRGLSSNQDLFREFERPDEMARSLGLSSCSFG